MEKQMDVVCIGMMIADVLVQGVPGDLFEKEVSMAQRVCISTGGDALNQAIVLSHLGHTVRIVSRIGNDTVGMLVKGIVENNGIDTSYVSVKDNTNTTTNVVMIREDGERTFISHPGSLEELSGEDVPTKAVENCKVLSVGSLCAHPQLKDEDLVRIFKCAKENGAYICADIIMGNKGLHLDSYKNALKYVDFIFPNEEEGTFHTGKTTPSDIADAFLAYGVKNVIVSMGKKGCYIKNAEEEMTIPAYLVTPLDTTGAGDNFAAGFISGLVRGSKLKDAARMGCAAASLAVRKLGATAGVESYAQIEQVMSAED